MRPEEPEQLAALRQKDTNSQGHQHPGLDNKQTDQARFIIVFLLYSTLSYMELARVSVGIVECIWITGLEIGECIWIIGLGIGECI